MGGATCDRKSANSAPAASGAIKQPRLAITPCAAAAERPSAAPDADEVAADTAGPPADAEPVAHSEWSPPADPREPPARREEAVYFRLVEGATADEYLEALLEFVPARLIRFAGVERAPNRFAAYLDSGKTVAEFARRHGYVRVRHQRLGAYTALQPPFRLVLSNVRPVIPNAVLERALAGELELRLCSPIDFLRADSANPALRELRGFRRSVICCAASAGDDEGARVELVPPSMAVEYDAERFHIELSAEELSEGSGAPKPATNGTEQQPAATGDGRTAAVKRRAPSSASDDLGFEDEFSATVLAPEIGTTIKKKGILKRNERLASSTPFPESSRRKAIPLNVSFFDDVEAATGNDTLSPVISHHDVDTINRVPNGFTMRPCSVVLNCMPSHKSKRRMTGTEARRRAESFNCSKKALEMKAKSDRSGSDYSSDTSVKRSTRMRNKRINYRYSSQTSGSSSEEEPQIVVNRSKMTTPYVRLRKLNSDDITSYKITPLKEDRIPKKSKTADDYGIDDINTDDSTDDEEFPKKHIPQWAKDYKNQPPCQSYLDMAMLDDWMRPPKFKYSLRHVFFSIKSHTFT